MRGRAGVGPAGTVSTRGQGKLIAAAVAVLLAALLGATAANALVPTASIEAASEISFTTAKAKGEVNPQGKATNWSFQYIADAKYQQNLGEAKPGFEGAATGPSGSTSTTATVEGQLSGLKPGTEYHLRLLASNADGPAEAVAPTFTTLFSAPSAVTGAADHIAATHAQLHGTVNPHYGEAVYWFEYGPQDCETGPCAAVPASEKGAAPSNAAGEGAQPFSVSQAVPGLEAETTYHFRVVAKNAFGTTPGTDETFTTPATPGPEACANEALREEQHATFLPDCRAYEMVSPPDKNGGNVAAVTGGTRAAFDGSAVAFKSLAAFADATGTEISTDYIAERSSEDPGPLGTGWVTHSITPAQGTNSYAELLAILEHGYEGEFTANLGAAVTRPLAPLTDEPYVANIPNLYLRTDLRTPGPGSYQLVTACPRCVETGKALPAPKSAIEAQEAKPVLAGLSADGERAIFESVQRLTTDTPASVNSIQLFEYHQGTVGLVDHIPSGAASECDDLGAPACAAGKFAVAGFGTRGGADDLGVSHFPFHAISDGSDGHSRVFFTRPTQAASTALKTHSWPGGQIFVREDGHYTALLNASERTPADSYAAARFWDATPNGERVLFTSPQALTEDAPIGSGAKLYMYDASKPGSDPHNLTLLGADHEPADGSTSNVSGVIGTSADASHVYFLAQGQLIAGAPALGGANGIYLWQEGTLSYVGVAKPADEYELLFGGSNGVGRQARVSANGSQLLFAAANGAGLLGYDHGYCPENPGCRELYLYDDEGSTPSEPDLRCATCNPSGAAAKAMASDETVALRGASNPGFHVNHALSEDGRYVFFSSAEALVAEDTNGTEDAYEYDSETEEVHLLSSGTFPTDSWFMDATPDGSNAFIVTAQPLVGWDHDSSYDLYDVKVGGGFPEPVPHSAPCASTETCKEALGESPRPAAIGSGLEGPGNPEPKRPRCPKGRRPSRVNGKTRCVKPKKHHAKRHKQSAARKGGGK